MLRSYDQIRFDVPASRLLAAGEGCFMIDGGGKRYRTPWHWHDCVMILLPISGSIEFRDETRHAGTWLAQDRFVVVPKTQMHETVAATGHRHLAVYVSDSLIAGAQSSLGTLARLNKPAGSPRLTFAHCSAFAQRRAAILRHPGCRVLTWPRHCLFAFSFISSEPSRSRMPAYATTARC